MNKVKTSLGVWAVAVFTGACAWGWNSISVPGSIFANQWNPGVNDLPTHSGSVWSGDLAVTGAGDFKFAADHGWANAWGEALTIERLPAYGVGPLSGVAGSPNLHLGVNVAQTIHFAFDDSALTCDLTGVAAPAVTSVRLIGDFNQNGAIDGGDLSAAGAGQWTTDLALTTGDNLRLLVNGGEWWGAIKSSAAALPASLSMCGSAETSIADFRSGTFHVAFDASTLMLSIAQTATNEFRRAGIAADSSNLANLARQDVNLMRENGLYVGTFWWNGGDFDLSFSERDENGTPGGIYWTAQSSSPVTVTAGVVTETYTQAAGAGSVVRRTFRASVPGMYRITFNPDTGVATLQRSYTAQSGINLVGDPSLETGSGWNFYNAQLANTADTASCLHSGRAAGMLLPLQRHTEESNFGSISTVVGVGNDTGSILKVSAWMRRLGEWNASRTRLWIEWKDADWNTVAEKDMTIYDLGSFWKKYSLEAEIPEGATQANILFQFQEAREGDGYVYLDDVEVRLSSGRSVNFDTWTPVENAFGNYSPDWRGTGVRTTNNLTDAYVESGGVFFSRYVEGSNNNKALELFNPTAAAVSLSGWTIEQYDNGSSTPTATFALSGSIPTGGCFLVTRPVAAPYDKLTPVAAALQEASDLQCPLTFNGDDVIVLRDNSGAIMDRIGEVRANLTGSLLNYVLRDHTLVRSSYTSHGTTNGLSETFPYAEWEVFPADTFDGLKTHVRSLPSDVYIPSGLSLVFGPQGRLESPADPLDGGIGDISFWYRTAFPETAGRTGKATLILEAATDSAFANATELATIDVPATQYAFVNYSLRLDLPGMSYFRIRQTNVTDNSYARIDDLSVTAPLPISRYQDFGLWTNANWAAYVGTYSLAGWTLASGKISPSGGLSASPAAILPPGASVVSPAIEGGVGLILFATRNDPDDEDAGDYAVTVEASTDGGEKWTAIGTFSTNGATWVSTRYECGETADTIVRFTSTGSGNAILENIELRIPEGDSRNQNFDSWLQDKYGTSRHQGWFLSSGLTAVKDGQNEDGMNGTKGLRMKDANAYVQSAALEGGIGTLSFYAKPHSASHKPSFQVDISADGGATWKTVYTNRLDGSKSLEWQPIEVAINREDVTHVRILNKLSSSATLNVDSIVCGKIPVPPSISVVPFSTPEHPYPGDTFKLGAYVHPGGSARAADIKGVTIEHYTRLGVKVEPTVTNELSYFPDQGAWLSPSFAGLPDRTIVTYTVIVTWTSNGVDTVTSAPAASFQVSELANSGVWINEVVYAALDNLDGGGDCDPWDVIMGLCGDAIGGVEGHEYVEICGPAGTKLDGWKLELQFLNQADISANNGKATYATYTFKAATTIPTNALTLSSQTSETNGYGFFVVGDQCDEWNVNVVLTNDVPAFASAGAGDNIYFGPGVINLKNAQNVVVDSICYGTRVAGSHYIGQGQDTDSHSLSAYTPSGSEPGYNGDTFEWNNGSDPSPGAANANQEFQPRPSSDRKFVDGAFHDPSLTIVPNLKTENPFDMIYAAPASVPAKPVTVREDVNIVLGYPASYGENGGGSLLLRLQGEETYRAYSADLLPNSQSGDNSFIAAKLPAGTFKRLDTIEYYFVFNPDDTYYNDTYIAAAPDGGGESGAVYAKYEDEDAAAGNPFVFTFPFHDTFEFISLSQAATSEVLGARYPFTDTVSFPSEPGALAKLMVFLPVEYTYYPDPSELGLEGTSDPRDAGSWEKKAAESIEAIPLNTGADEYKGTYYAIQFEPDGTPMFFRLAPTRQVFPVNAAPEEAP